MKEEYTPQFDYEEKEIVNKESIDKSANKKDKFQLKNLIWEIPSVILILIFILFFVAGSVLNLIGFFQTLLQVIKNIGNGNLILGICLLPFSVWGIIQLVRGFFALCETEKISSVLGAGITLLGFAALFISISNL